MEDGSTYQSHPEVNFRPRTSTTPQQNRKFYCQYQPIFWTVEQRTPATLLQILLVRAGVEQNPGPQKWYCSVCSLEIKNTTSVLCNSCKNWSHFRRCSGLAKTRDWSPMHISPCCTPPSTPTGSIQALNTLFDGEPTPCKILQFNCNGLSKKIDEIIHYMDHHKITVAAIQETRLTSNSRVKNCENYTILRKDRGKGTGGGLAFLIHDSVMYQAIDPPNNPQRDDHLEIQCIRITSGESQITLVNLYIPPTSSCESGYQTSIQHLLQLDDCVIMGDFNAHNDLWHSELVGDQRGDIIADEIDNSSFGVLNEPAPTRVAVNTNSSPDITIASASLLPCTSWKVELALSSDHLPISINLNRSIEKSKTEKRTFINFSKANWTDFTSFTEIELSKAGTPTNIFRGEKTFRDVMLKARSKFIPSGRIPLTIPSFPKEAATLADKRDRIRKSNPADPEIAVLNRKISKLVDEHKKSKWEEYLKSATFNQGPKDLWKTIKSLTNPPRTKPNNTISFDNTPALCPKKCATLFNCQFTECPTRCDPALRKALRRSHKRARAETTSLSDDDLHSVNDTFTTDMIAAAIKKTKTSKAIGPDGISAVMVKHLGQTGRAYLTTLFNMSVSSLLLPSVWKVGRIIPILKPGKSADEAKSYRPISLLSPIIKLLEQLILAPFSDHLNLADHQHGFRKGRSTTTALHQLHDQVCRGLNEKRPCSRTVLVALDLSKAFDTVSHTHLITYIHDTSAPLNIKRWLTNYLRGRNTYVEFRNAVSKYRKMKQGVPQGGVLSPSLFNLLMSKIPPPPHGVRLISYADDCTILSTGNDIAGMCDTINTYLDTLENWFTQHSLSLSPEKSTATLFTSWTKEVNTTLPIQINGRSVPTVPNPKILGVIFDPMLTFNAHAVQTRNKLKSRNNILKCLSGTTWGKEKETMLRSYKAINRPILNYAAPVWSPQLSNTHWRNLQTCQNAALRSVTGCVLMTDEDHLHRETQILHVQRHNTMIAQQYLLACHQQNHTCNQSIQRPADSRNIRKSIHDMKPSLAWLSPTPTMTDDQYKDGVKAIHKRAVDHGVNSLKCNIVLGGYPPPIHAAEQGLPRRTRTILAQLRSGYSTYLNSYLSRIDNTTSDACPKCHQGPHDTNHLFNCPMNPTTLTSISLWTDPLGAARFLELEMEDT